MQTHECPVTCRFQVSVQVSDFHNNLPCRWMCVTLCVRGTTADFGETKWAVPTGVPPPPFTYHLPVCVPWVTPWVTVGTADPVFWHQLVRPFCICWSCSECNQEPLTLPCLQSNPVCKMQHTPALRWAAGMPSSPQEWSRSWELREQGVIVCWKTRCSTSVGHALGCTRSSASHPVWCRGLQIRLPLYWVVSAMLRLGYQCLALDFLAFPLLPHIFE